MNKYQVMVPTIQVVEAENQQVAIFKAGSALAPFMDLMERDGVEIPCRGVTVSEVRDE